MTRVRHPREPVGQRRRQDLRVSGEFDLPQRQIGEVVNNRADRARYRHEHDS
jgi:hypothetical protein